MNLFQHEVSDNQHFVDKLNIKIADSDFKRIEKKLDDELSFINETTICERIISPILELPTKFSATVNLQEIFDVLNWMFNTIRA